MFYMPWEPSERHDGSRCCAWDGVWVAISKSRKIRGIAVVHTRRVAQTKVGTVKLERSCWVWSIF